MRRSSRRAGKLPWLHIIGALILFGGCSSLFSGGEERQASSPVTTTAPAPVTGYTAPSVQQQIRQPDIEALRAAANTAEPAPAADPQGYQQPYYPAQQQAVSQAVYVTDTGGKYHQAGCRYLRLSSNAISLSAAQARGFSACSRCF